MEAICQACGDRGWQENLICCSKCSDAYEHRYCLEDASKIFQLHVKWTCPDCLPSPKKRPWIRKTVDASLSLRRSKRQYEKSERQTNVSNEISPEKGSNARKMIPEAVTPQMKNSNGSSTVDFVEPPLVVDLSDHSLLNDDISVIVGKKDPPSLDDNLGKGSAFSQKAVPVSDHFVSDAFAKGGSPLNNNCYIPAQPVEDPIWKGCFSISSKDFESVDGMAAHLSSKAYFKVRDEASLLPVNLSSDILPKADVWPKIFQQAKPSDDTIGLYFFPETERDEKIYNSLIENMMINDLAYFGTCEFAKSAMAMVGVVPRVLVPPLAGALGNVVSSWIMVPKELITQRMQAGAKGRSWEVLLEVLGREGVMGLYKGYWATLLRNLPAGVLSYLSFEYLKAGVLVRRNGEQLEPVESVCCGALAGAISASLTTPLDVVKTRLMTQGVDKAAAVMYGGVVEMVKFILKEEGWVGFTRGMGPRVVHSACFSALGYFAFETARLTIMNDYVKRKEHKEIDDAPT